MKIFLALLLAFSSLSVSALSCKCNCNPADRTLCASDYDLDRPCKAVCASGTPALGIMVTACPVVLVPHPFTGVKQWVVACPN